MGCIYDYPLEPYICDADWNCVECPNWIDESEESESQATGRKRGHMINNNVVFVEKVLEDIPKWLQIIRSKEKKITPHEIYLIRKIRNEAEIILAESEE